MVLTVCLGNICRSPTAEAVIREAAADAGVDLEVRSAGTGGWHVGEPAHPQARRTAARFGLRMDGRAAQLVADDLAAADLVLAMDRANLADILDLAGRTGVDPFVRLLRSYDPASVAAGDLEVPDPYGGREADYLAVLEMCRAAAPQVVAAIAGRRPHPPA